MLLTSYEYLIFILLLLGFYYLAPKKWQTGLLLCAGLLFYLRAGVFSLLFVLLSSGVTFFLTRSFTKKEKRTVFAVVACNVALLVISRYVPFFAREGVRTMGTAYYVLMAVAYGIDVYRGKCTPEKNPFRLVLFLSFFPTASMGPVARYDALKETLFQPHSFRLREVQKGALRILFGFFKKLVVADRLRIAVLALTGGAGYDGAFTLLLMLFYTVQLYADFTGGIDIALGTAQMFGITLPENFDLPYGAKTLASFWNRWHITMGRWFTEYVFYPFSTSGCAAALMRLLKRCMSARNAGRVVVWISTLLVWALTGLWHGAGASFLVWGLMNGLILLVSRELTPLCRRAHARFPGWFSSPAWNAFCVFRTLFIVSSLRLFDCYRDVPRAFRSFASIFTMRGLGDILSGNLSALGPDAADYAVAAAGVLLMRAVSRLHAKGGARRAVFAKPYMVRTLLGTLLLLAVLIFGVYGKGYDAAAFLYSGY